MGQFEFISKEEGFEQYRSSFANQVCKLLYLQNSKNLDKAIEKGEDILIELNEHVRNIYELVDSSIPLMAYHDLKRNGADNFDFNEQEYKQALENTINACMDYYN